MRKVLLTGILGMFVLAATVLTLSASETVKKEKSGCSNVSTATVDASVSDKAAKSGCADTATASKDAKAAGCADTAAKAAGCADTATKAAAGECTKLPSGVKTTSAQKN